MAKLDLTVEIDDNSLLAALAEVREKQRALNEAVGKLERIITGRYSEITPNAAVVKEKPQE